jgi:gamma-glutamylcyclotransferase (GGCT)/AIG2-like uncharacterized protein YtfP
MLKKAENETDPSYLVLYGSLMSMFSTLDDLGLRDELTLVRECRLAARLYDLGDYPGLTLSHEQTELVHAELYTCSNPKVFRILDEFEDYKPGNDHASLYKRVQVNLLEPNLKAWVYVYNQAVSESDLIACGSWDKYLTARNI